MLDQLSVSQNMADQFTGGGIYISLLYMLLIIFKNSIQ